MASEILKERTTGYNKCWANGKTMQTLLLPLYNMSEMSQVSKSIWQISTMTTKGKCFTFQKELQASVETFEAWLQSLLEDVAILKKVILQGATLTSNEPPKLRVPKLKGFTRDRNTKELEVSSAHVPDSKKVHIANMYLSSNAKLQWQTSTKDNQESGRPLITS